MKKKDKIKLQNKYDNLSIVDRNAYEQVVERNRNPSRWIGYPFFVIKMLTIFAVFFISTALLIGENITIFTDGYMSIFTVLIIVTPFLMLLGIVFDILDYIKINKLKRKLLS